MEPRAFRHMLSTSNGWRRIPLNYTNPHGVYSLVLKGNDGSLCLYAQDQSTWAHGIVRMIMPRPPVMGNQLFYRHSRVCGGTSGQWTLSDLPVNVKCSRTYSCKLRSIKASVQGILCTLTEIQGYLQEHSRSKCVLAVHSCRESLSLLVRFRRVTSSCSAFLGPVMVCCVFSNNNAFVSTDRAAV